MIMGIGPATAIPATSTRSPTEATALPSGSVVPDRATVTEMMTQKDVTVKLGNAHSDCHGNIINNALIAIRSISVIIAIIFRGDIRFNCELMVWALEDKNYSS